jgi:hypothetical protein
MVNKKTLVAGLLMLGMFFIHCGRKASCPGKFRKTELNDEQLKQQAQDLNIVPVTETNIRVALPYKKQLKQDS